LFVTDPALRPRTAPEILDAAVQLTRGVYLRLLVIGALFYIPSVLARLVGLRPAESAAALSSRDFLLLAYDQAWTGLGWAVMMVLLAQHLLSNRADVGEALQRVHEDAWRITALSTAAGLATVFGLVLFVIPGIYLGVRLFAVPQTLLFEKTTIGESVARSLWLSKHDNWRLAWAALLTFAVDLAVWAGARFLVLIVLPDSWVADSVAGAITLLIDPIIAAVWLLLYFDVRMRAEGWDLDRDLRKIRAEQEAR
jgi:hypothetical protein